MLDGGPAARAATPEDPASKPKHRRKPAFGPDTTGQTADVWRGTDIDDPLRSAPTGGAIPRTGASAGRALDREARETLPDAEPVVWGGREIPSLSALPTLGSTICDHRRGLRSPEGPAIT